MVAFGYCALPSTLPLEAFITSVPGRLAACTPLPEGEL